MQTNDMKAEPTTGAPEKGEFVKVEGGEPERTSAEGSVIVAYLLMWGIMVFFVGRTFRALKSLASDAERLVRVAKGSK